MQLTDLNIAAYLDEAGDDLESAISNLKSLAINYVVIRNLWPTNVSMCSDSTLNHVRTVLDNSGLSIVALLFDSIGDIQRCLNIASYLKVQYIRMVLPDGKQFTNNFISNLDRICGERGLQILLEPGVSASLSSFDFVTWCQQNQNVHILFDPVELLIKHNVSVAERWLVPLSDYIVAVDVRDYNHGFGNKAIGFGIANINTIVSKLESNFNRWYFLEPKLGRRYGSAVTRSETFKLAYLSFDSLLQSIE